MRQRVQQLQSKAWSCLGYKYLYWFEQMQLPSNKAPSWLLQGPFNVVYEVKKIMLLVINFEGRSTFYRKWLCLQNNCGNQGRKTSVYALRPTSSCISFVRHNNMSFHCHEMSLQWFFTVNSPVIFLKYTFELVYNTVRSASNGVCRWNCHGKGLKLKTFHRTYIIILSSVVVRKSRIKLKMLGSNP